jgi:glyoxylase-like metal-dependent hydrolase (beta-lactamase superfamily II)
MIEIAPNIWRWTRRHPEWHPGAFGAEVASFWMRDDVGLVIVDPLLDGKTDPVLHALESNAFGTVRILITVPYHVRSAELVWNHLSEDYDTAIFGHALCAKRLESAVGLVALKGGETLAGDVRVHPIGSPRRSELPFEIPSHRALAFGDAVVETGKGALRVWDDPVDSAARKKWWDERFLPTLRPLAKLDVERVLVTHGQPVLKDGAKALAKAFGQPPWQR